jgi:hypothetical protein
MPEVEHVPALYASFGPEPLTAPNDALCGSSIFFNSATPHHQVMDME